MRAVAGDAGGLLQCVKHLSKRLTKHEATIAELETRARQGETDAHHALAAKDEALRRQKNAEEAARSLRLQVRDLQTSGVLHQPPVPRNLLVLYKPFGLSIIL